MAAAELLRHWIGDGLLRRWGRAIVESCAGPNDPASVQRIIAERDAALQHCERARWAAGTGGTAIGAVPGHAADFGGAVKKISAVLYYAPVKYSQLAGEISAIQPK